jgi:hypothetical protein
MTMRLAGWAGDTEATEWVFFPKGKREAELSTNWGQLQSKSGEAYREGQGGGATGIRTQNQLLKRQLLYH